MFQGCTGLTEAPALPAATLARYCYQFMFRNCTGLARPPALPARMLADYCYSGMFYGCTGIRLHTDGPGTEWGIPANAISANYWNRNMFFRTGGSFTGNPEIGAIYYYEAAMPPEPEKPIFATDGTGIVVSGGKVSIKIINARAGTWYTLYWTDELGGEWIKGPVIQAPADGNLVFGNVDASVPRRFFKVGASNQEPTATATAPAGRWQ